MERRRPVSRRRRSGLTDSAARGARPDHEDDTRGQKQQREGQGRDQQVRAGDGEQRDGADAGGRQRTTCRRRDGLASDVTVVPRPSSTVLSPMTEMALPPRVIGALAPVTSWVPPATPSSPVVMASGRHPRRATTHPSRSTTSRRRPRWRCRPRSPEPTGRDDLRTARDPVRAVGGRGVARARSAARSVGDRRTLRGGVADHADRVAADDDRDSGIRQHLRAAGDAVVTGGRPRGAAGLARVAARDGAGLPGERVTGDADRVAADRDRGVHVTHDLGAAEDAVLARGGREPASPDPLAPSNDEPSLELSPSTEMALPPIVTGTLASTTPCVPPSSAVGAAGRAAGRGCRRSRRWSMHRSSTSRRAPRSRCPRR